MRILHVIDHAPPTTSAYARRVMAILRQQRALGWQTCHLTSNPVLTGEATTKASKWHFYRTPAPRSAVERLPLIGAVNVLAQRLEQVVQLTRPDLLHAHSPVENALAALRVGRRHNVPVVFEPHAPSPSSPAGSVWSGAGRRRRGALSRFAMRALEAWAAARAGAVITNTEGMRLRLRHGGIPERKITLVPDAIELGKFPPVAPGGKRPADDIHAPVLLGFAGGAGQQLELVLAALVLLRRHNPATLLVACVPAQFDAVREAVARHGLAGQVELLAAAVRTPSIGAAAPAPALLRQAEVLLFAQASNQVAAAPPRALLEAMAHGCLVLAPDTPAHRSVIEHGRSGMLFAQDDAAAMAGAMNVLLARRGRWPSMRSAARWFIEYHRSWETCAQRYGPVYDRLLENRRRR